LKNYKKIYFGKFKKKVISFFDKKYHVRETVRIKDCM